MFMGNPSSWKCFEGQFTMTIPVKFFLWTLFQNCIQNHRMNKMGKNKECKKWERRSLVRSACLLFSMLAEMVSYGESPPINSLYGKYKTIECTKFSFFMFLLISPLMNRFYPSVVATLMSHVGQIPSKILILLGFEFVVLANHDKKQVLLSQNGVLSSPRQKTQVQDEKIELQSVSLDCCSIPLNSCLIAA